MREIEKHYKFYYKRIQEALHYRRITVGRAFAH